MESAWPRSIDQACSGKNVSPMPVSLAEPPKPPTSIVGIAA